MGGRSACPACHRASQGGGGKLTAALRWWFENGTDWRAAKKQAEADDTDIPEDLQPPDILDGYGGWYEDFWSLSTERQIGMAVGQIPASAIERRSAGMEDEDAQVFEFCMRQMDEVYLMHQNKADDTTSDPSVSARDAFRAATKAR